MLRLRRLAPLGCLGIVVALGLSQSPNAEGAAAPPMLANPRVHPETSALFSYRTRTGKTFPAFQRNAEFERTGRLPVVVRFANPPTTDQARQALHARGVDIVRNTPIVSGAWLATTDERGLQSLTADPNVTRVSVDLFRHSPRPLDKSLTETRADVAKRAAIVKNGKRLDGKGVVIADIDSGLFVHHPALFHADGGAFAWIDVDGDKRFSANTDGIDLDGNGKIEASEVLHDLRSQALSLLPGETIDTHQEFEADLDYLYLDKNGNGKRDYGEGFNESTPALGEPMFVFDDANHDGILDETERVLQLKTSKVQAIGADDKTYLRGKTTDGLIDYTPERDPVRASAMYHGTGVAGILVGGISGVSRWTGIAPEAELLLNDSSGSRGSISAVQWAVDQKADIILTEYAPYSGVTLDGSSEDETVLDAATEKGIVSVSPAGNLVGGFKHRTISLAAGASTKTVPLKTDLDSQYILIALHYRGTARNLTLTLDTPDGNINLPDAAPAGETLPNGSFLYVFDQTTPRGTHERFVSLIGQSPFTPGNYTLTAQFGAGSATELDLYAGDEVSSWEGGFTFDSDTPTRTICSPSTSDKTISVAAYVLHPEEKYYPAGNFGDIARYSSRGPMLDGTTGGIEIAAPDNPMSIRPPDTDLPGQSSFALWAPFGGTSGAGPHVAAGVALIMESFPNASVDDIKKRLYDNARPFTNLTDKSVVGAGKLDIAKALGADVGSSEPPQVTIKVKKVASEGIDGILELKVDDDGAETGLSARWDLDYDGKLDTDWAPLGEQALPVNDAVLGAKIPVKVEVRDADGNINGATALIEVVEPQPETPAPGAGPKTTVTEEGCGCRTIGTTSRAASTSAAVIATALAAILRRRRRRQRDSRSS